MTNIDINNRMNNKSYLTIKLTVKSLGFYLFFLSGYSFAEANTGAHSNEIPSVILWQFFNLGVLFLIIYKYTKIPIKNYFDQKQKDYLSQAEKSKAIYLEAEKEYHDIKHRLEILQNSSDESIARARLEAMEMKKNIIKEAEESAHKIGLETLLSIKIEAQKAYQSVQKKLVLDSIVLAKGLLTKDIGAQDHLRLQSDFNKNIEATNP
ncbi:MAG: ATP synthase F0 subunit B [Deltaproteobacteria bacterium]|jgi:F-type H+-transporting ATPase subunit b|nr:ATP synthase F0 subunit B [Deltaproteobacteria bacterium]